MTITGSGFGAAVGSSQVWLGTANGVVQNWSDTQVVALVAVGATSGNAQVLQNGVLSNAVPFTVNTLQLTSVDPASGVAGTNVTFTGTGFGFSQGSGKVWLGSTPGQVVSWSDTQVVASVAATAVTGIARIQQNGAWSNAVGFTVPASGGNTVVPSMLNMVVGDTRTIQALNSAGQPVTGLTWTSSDPTVVSLSSDNPPLLSALAAGHVTITAGSASADVTVSAGALLLGTVIWSNPGDGSGVTRIVPAVPSASGVADVFAFQRDGTVQAITSDGTTAWTADVSQAWNVLPDFQGGLVLEGSDNSIVKLDGITGQPYSAYTPDSASLGSLAVHPDGTIFAIQANWTSDDDRLPDTVIGIDPITGMQKFSVTLDIPADSDSDVPFEYGLIVAGDGYAYVPYAYRARDNILVNHLMLLRIGSSGAYDKIKVLDLTTPYSEIFPFGPVDMITNGDTGILLAWSSWDGDTEACGLALTTGASVSLISAPGVAGQTDRIIPALQAQDGSFVAAATAGEFGDPYMIAFDEAGNLRWSVAGNWQPQIATADGGVIATNWDTGAAIIFDQNGNATGQMASLPTYSWLGNTYQYGSTNQVAARPLYVAMSFWAFLAASQSGNSTAVNQQWFPPLASCTDKGGSCQGPLGPRDLLWNAKQDLARQLTSDQACMTAANTYLFNKVQYGGFLGFFSGPINGSQFALYIQNTQLFYNGPKSTLDFKTAKCGIPEQAGCVSATTPLKRLGNSSPPM